KLLHKNILANAFASLAIIVVGGLITYDFIVTKVNRESEEHLLGEKTAVEKKIKEGFAVANFENNIGDKIELQEITQTTGRKSFFKTINEKEEYEENEEANEEGEEIFQAKAIVFECSSPDKIYRVTIIKSFDNDEELAKNILFAVGISAVLMIISIVLVNFFIYKKLWSPFYGILKELQNYNVSKHDGVTFSTTQTEEFNELVNSLNSMAHKIAKDYLALKEFTENASHEIQTPLAVIQSKIEMCLQDKHLSAQQAEMLIGAAQAVNTLVNLNKGLITLTKLENNQVEAASTIDLLSFFHNRLALFEDFVAEKNISVNLNIDTNYSLKINEALAGVLFDNLIKNAVKHNTKDGKIVIEASGNKIRISNTGEPPKADTEKFFERFYKDSGGDSLGLGLAIVKKICDVYGYKISYAYKERYHSLEITTGE
ncbi:MAG: sensor histidine kinase, partial [Bacteroidia bacterium]